MAKDYDAGTKFIVSVVVEEVNEEIGFYEDIEYREIRVCKTLQEGKEMMEVIHDIYSNLKEE